MPEEFDAWLRDTYPDLGSDRARMEEAARDLWQLDEEDAVAVIGRR
jgi:hypothetical protein